MSSVLCQNAISIVVPDPQSCQPITVVDNKKSRVTLLFSGIFLCLVGMTFTAMGWISYDGSRGLEWTQLLGPVLLSLGGSLMLASICKFREFSCQRNDEGDIMSDLEQVPTGQAFLFNSVFQGATMVQYNPPSYASVTQGMSSPVGFLPNCQPLGVPVNLPPQSCTVCPLENPVFQSEDTSPHNRDTERRVSRHQETYAQQEDEKGYGDGNTSLCTPPPAYKELYPSLQTEASDEVFLND